MAWDDKTRRLTIDPDDLDIQVMYRGDRAKVTLTEYSDYGSGRSNKQAVLWLDDWFLERLAEDALGRMLEVREDRIEKLRGTLRDL